MRLEQRRHACSGDTGGIAGLTVLSWQSIIGGLGEAVAGLLIYRRFDWRRTSAMLVETASLAGAILFIVGAANCMAWRLTQSGFSHNLVATMAAVPGGAWASLASRLPRSSPSAACPNTSRRWFCSVRCCSRSRSSSG